MAVHSRWTDEKTERLIMLLEERPCLYNTKLKEYFNRDKRKKALEDIATTLGVSGKRVLKYTRVWTSVSKSAYKFHIMCLDELYEQVMMTEP